MRATDWANVWATGRANIRATGKVRVWDSERNDWRGNHAKARAGKWLKRE